MNTNDWAWLTNDGDEPDIWIDIDLDVTVDEVRRAINEAAEASPHWCAACGKLDASPICHACERDVWWKSGGRA